MSNFWDLIWLIFSAFMFVAYLLILFQVITDLFRDSELGGGYKALWLIALVFLPMLTAAGVWRNGSGLPWSAQKPRPTLISGRLPGSHPPIRLPTPRSCSTPARSARRSSPSSRRRHLPEHSASRCGQRQKARHFGVDRTRQFRDFI